jgi:hypothetical protein
MTLPVSERIAVAKEDCLTVLKERLSRLKTLAERIVGIETTDKLFEERKNLLTSMAKASRRSGSRNEHRRRAKRLRATSTAFEACCWCPDQADLKTPSRT